MQLSRLIPSVGRIGVKSSQQDSIRTFHSTCQCYRFHEYDPKGPWRDMKWREEMAKESFQEQRKNFFGLKTGFKELRDEIGKWKQEVHDRFNDPTHYIVMHADRHIFVKFNTKEKIDHWLKLSDSDNSHGYSKCNFELSPTGHGLFHGYVNQTVPRDGVIHRTGYCAVKCPRKTKSFYRDDWYNWDQYNILVMRVRGDGRTYMINLNTTGYYDIHWNDVYSYPLHTRGGPYWQDVRIPFSKFVFQSKGRVQDKQLPLPRHEIAAVGVVAAKVDGPFCLEIDYIGIEYDINHTEEYAYELYEVPMGIVDV